MLRYYIDVFHINSVTFNFFSILIMIGQNKVFNRETLQYKQRGSKDKNKGLKILP